MNLNQSEREASTVASIKPVLSQFQTWRQFASMLVIVISWDRLVYQTNGGATGWALFIFIAAVCFGVAAFSRSYSRRVVFIQLSIVALLLLLIARCCWQWNPAIPGLSLLTLAAFALSVHGLFPWVDRLVIFAPQVFVRAAIPLGEITKEFDTFFRRLFGSRWKEWAIPVAICFGFAVVFLLANPATVTLVWNRVSTFFSKLGELLGSYFLLQMIGWVSVGIVALGAMVAPAWILAFEKQLPWSHGEDELMEHILLPISRYRINFNTLLSVIVLFAIYLCLEFSNFWFREFPEGFQYSGYAHRGAAWLTVALAVATFLLSWIFRSNANAEQTKRLQLLAWTWSGLNLLLALSVCNRMWIYVQFNGMTRMRIVGYFGIACVTIGFVLVLFKIMQHKSLAWLIHRQLIALIVFVILLAVTPMDMIAYNWNRASIQTNQIRPSVQIVAHSLSSEGYQAILPLIDHEDETIREGVKAMLARRLHWMRSEIVYPIKGRVDQLSNNPPGMHWTHYQGSDSQLRQSLEERQSILANYLEDSKLRDKAIDQFYRMAMQWY